MECDGDETLNEKISDHHENYNLDLRMKVKYAKISHKMNEWENLRLV